MFFLFIIKRCCICVLNKIQTQQHRRNNIDKHTLKKKERENSGPDKIVYEMKRERRYLF
jgi:hypothetical protein